MPVVAPRRPLLLLALLVAILGSALPAGAHTQIQRATPGPGETVEGPVDFVVLEFLDPVVPTPTIEVTGPGGAPVAGLGETRLIADDVARVGFDPLTGAGDYRVDYVFAALDGATQEGAHQFTVEPSSGRGADVGAVVAWTVGAVLVALLAAAVLGRLRSSG
jgi:methionine-rich copper-binding protein CopC